MVRGVLCVGGGKVEAALQQEEGPLPVLCGNPDSLPQQTVSQEIRKYTIRLSEAVSGSRACRACRTRPSARAMGFLKPPCRKLEAQGFRGAVGQRVGLCGSLRDAGVTSGVFPSRHPDPGVTSLDRMLTSRGSWGQASAREL